MTTGDVDAASPADHIHLEIPALAGYARLARIGGAAVALRWGLGAQEVQDLRLAVDEAIILLLGDGDHSGQLDVDYRNTGDGVAIEVRARFADAPPALADDAIERFRTLAGPLVAEYEIASERVWFRVAQA